MNGVSTPPERPPMFVPPGHFYSPVPSRADVEAYREHRSKPLPETLPGIDLRLEAQAGLLATFKGFYDEQPFKAERHDGARYWLENGFFEYGDGLALYCMFRLLQPRRVIEIGSGFSSAAALDVSERYLGSAPELTFIDPNPERLLELARPGDLERHRLLRQPVQAVPLSEFAALADRDVLLIDSTHVSRLGSDVNYEFFEVLPRLAAGVYVHVHDIFYPFDYPLAWVEEGRGWNESYLLRSFLQFNDAFEIVWFNDLVTTRFRDQFERDFPLWLKNSGGSIWLRKVR